MRNKIFISIILSIAVLISPINNDFSSFAIYEDEYSYVIKNCVVTITDYIGLDTNVNIPVTLGGLPVREIGDFAFSDCENINNLIIPEGVEVIGSNAFEYCRNLAEIDLPESMIKIGDWAFMHCGLTAIYIPDNVVAIGERAFWYNSNLSEVEFGAGLNEICDYVFYYCSNLASVVIPDNVTKIGAGAFSGCSNLTYISIPESVTEIGNSAFSTCSSLTNILLPSDLKKIDSFLLSGCSSLNSITLPDSIEVILGSAFSGTTIETIYLPEGVMELGENHMPLFWAYSYGAFDGCEFLKEIIVDPDNNTFMSIDGVVYSKDGSKLIQYPAGKSEQQFIVPEFVTEISDSAFYGVNNLTRIKIPESVTRIGVEAFQACSNLTSINIPPNLERINQGTFRECRNLKTITIPSSVTRICTRAFLDLPRLEKVTFLGNAPFYEAEAFSYVSTHFTIYYIGESEGFTSPTWHGHKTEIFRYKNLDSFNYNPNEYNPKLALGAALFSMLAYTDYYREPFRVVKSERKEPAELMEELKAQGYYRIIPFNYHDDEMNNVSFVLAKKQVLYNGTERTLVSVIICGTDGVEWLGNMDVTGTEYRENITSHYSFGMALNFVRVELLDYIDPGENALLFVTGHSRGGGVANLVANSFSDTDFNGRVDEVFGYTFAAPNVTKTPDKTKTNIFNFCFYDDFVASVPLLEWDYDKHGQSFYITVEDLYKSNNDDFKKDMRLFAQSSYERDPEFNKKATEELIDYVEMKWQSTEKYYTKKYWVPYPTNPLLIPLPSRRTLYQFFRDTIAPLASKGLSVRTLSNLYEIKDYYFSAYAPITHFFIKGYTWNNYINDSHQVFTYFSALSYGGFDDEINKYNYCVNNYASIGYNYMSTTVPINPNPIERDQLIAFAQIEGNLEKLDWDLEDISTWSGITWNLDEENRVLGIDMKFKDLVGELDLSGFEKLQALDCSGNEIENINLSGCVELQDVNVAYNLQETLNAQGLSNLVRLICRYNAMQSLYIEGCSALEILDCSYNELDELSVFSHLQLTELYCNGNFLTSLDIFNNLLLTNLDCTWNYLDIQPSSSLVSQIEAMLIRQGSSARYSPQNISEQAQFNAHDISKLESLANQADNLEKLGWDLSSPREWEGVEWVQTGNEYYAHRIDISGLALEGTLELTDMAYLSYLSSVGNSFSSVDVSGCSSMRYFDCRYSDVENLDIAGCSDLMVLYCEYNFLTLDSDQALMSNIQGILLKEGSILQYLNQNIYAQKDEFNQTEYDSLADFANTQDNLQNLGWDLETPGQWRHVTWSYENGEYRVSKLDFSFESISGEIDLTGFDLLSEIDFSISKITGVILPEHITEIKDRTFYDCVDLEYVWMPDSIIFIGESAFYNCRNLGLGSLAFRLPDSLETIGETAFYNCLQITRLQIGDSVNHIGNSAFLGCVNLVSATFSGDSPDDFGIWVFDNTHSDFVILFDNGVGGFIMPTWQGYKTRAIFKVTFKDWDGSVLKTETVDHGSGATAPADPQREGYNFTGWSVAFSSITSDLIVTAQYSIIMHTITFDTDGGTAIAPITQEFLTAVIAPSDPTKVGYTFAGWGTEIPETIPAQDVTITALWTINQYTITFDVDGLPDPVTQDYGTAVTAPDEPTKVGYTFAGWDTEIPETMPAEEMIITALWTINQYTITFNTDGGSAVDPITQDYDSAITVPLDPIKTGYTFVGWDTEIPETMPAENITITALWTINTYTVTFKDWDGNILKTETVDYGSGATAPADPQRDGYTFTGWSVAFNSIAADLIVTAQYSKIMYTITFDTDGGIAIDPITQEFGTAVIAPSDPTKTGYTFAGWDTEIPGTMPAENVTITALWTINQYMITFDTDGGTAVDAIIQDYASVVTAPADPTKAGYTFTGWDTEIPGTMPAEDVTITALWTINQYTITFTTDGGTAVDAITQDYNTTVTAPADPTKVGYTFTGWDTEIPGTMPAEDVAITALWVINSYTVTFKDWNGSVLKTGEVDYGTAAVAPANPTQTGYTFTGWDVAFNNITADLEVTAQYSINSYKVTFNSQGGSTVTSKTADYNTSITAPTAPTHTGYTFGGWYKEAAGTNEWNFATDKVTSNITLYAKWQSNVPENITSGTYTVNNTKLYVSKIKYETTISAFMNGINEKTFVKAYKGTEEITGIALIGTGMLIKIMDGATVKKTYTAVVTGDINGDGKVTLTDFVQLKSHILAKSTLSGAYASAADLNGDGKITLTDFVKAKAHLLNKELITPQAY